MNLSLPLGAVLSPPDEMLVIPLLGKGGVAKTTSTGTLGHAFARAGLNTVIIDYDEQASLTHWLLGPDFDGPTIEDVLLGQKNWSEVLVEVAPNLALAPTLPHGLGAVENHIRDKERRSPTRLLAKALAPLKGHVHAVFLDVSSGLESFLDFNALETMTHSLLVTEASIMSLNANGDILANIRQMEEEKGQALFLGVLPARYQGNSNLAKASMAELERQAQARVFTPIRNTVKAGEVVALREFLADYAPQATATEDYDQVAIEILEAVGAVKTSTKSKEAS